jgi:hypothetical protein
MEGPSVAGLRCAHTLIRGGVAALSLRFVGAEVFEMSSKNIWAWAVPAAVAIFGCASTKQPVVARSSTTTTTVAEKKAVPTAIGGGPTVHVHTDGPTRLDPARADRLVEARKHEWRNDCYSPDLGVTSFIVDVEIAPDGRVEKATTASVNGDSGVAECVRGRLEKMTFPQTVEGGVHTFTFLFGR